MDLLKKYPELKFAMAFCKAIPEEQCHYGYLVTKHNEEINGDFFYLTYVMKITANDSINYEFKNAVWYRDFYTGSEKEEFKEFIVENEKHQHLYDALKKIYTIDETAMQFLSLIPVDPDNIKQSIQKSLDKAEKTK